MTTLRTTLALMSLALVAPAAFAGESPKPVNRIFLVGDQPGWVETRLEVRPQDRLTIRAGSVVCFSGGGEDSCVRPAGWERSEYAERWPGDAAACDDPFPQWNHASLIAMVGGEPVLVGRQTVVEGREGRVLLGINDCSFEGDYRNEGQFSVVAIVENPTAHAARGGRELIEEALDALGGGGVKSLSVRAACTGPGGEAFTTEVVSLLPDRTLFRQSSEAGSIELLAQGKKAWRIDRSKGKRSAAKKMQPFIVGHEFHMMLFELDTRFTDHSIPMEDTGDPDVASDGSVCLLVEMRDLYGAPAAVCLEPDTFMPVRLSFQPAGKKKEPTIEMELESWIEIDGTQFLQAFTLRQGEDVFTYSYEEILPNSVTRSVFSEISPRALKEIRKRAKAAAGDDDEPAQETEPPEPTGTPPDG